MMKTRVFALFLTVIFFGIAFLYFSTSAPGLVWDPAETGSLLASAMDPEYAHLADSPLYFIFARALFLLGADEFARVMNVFSLLSALSTLALFFLAVKRASSSRKAALLTASSLAVFPVFWRFALFSNYYTFWLALCWLFLLLLFKAKNNFTYIFPAAFVLSFSLLAFPLSIIFIIPLSYVLFERRGYFSARKIVFFVFSLLVPLLLVIAAAGFLGMVWGNYTALFWPSNLVGSSVGENIVTYFAQYFQNFYVVIFALSFLGFFFWDGGGKNIFRLLISFLITFIALPFFEISGGYLLLTTVLFFYAALGFVVLWEIISRLLNTDIGVAFENQLFVLVFRLKKKAKLVKYFCLGAFTFLGSLTIFWNLPLRYEMISRSKDVGAVRYVSRAQEILADRSVIFAENSRYEQALRYLAASESRSNLWIISDEVDSMELRRAGKRYLDLELPELKLYPAGIGVRPWFVDLVEKNKDSWDFYLTLDRPSGRAGLEVGVWEGYTLVAQEPLYEAKTTDLR